MSLASYKMMDSYMLQVLTLMPPAQNIRSGHAELQVVAIGISIVSCRKLTYSVTLCAF